MSSSSQRQTGDYRSLYPMTLSNYTKTPSSTSSTPVRSPTGSQFHSPDVKTARLPFSNEELAAMWQALPSPPRSADAGSGEAAGGKTKKRQEQNRNAQRLYRQRKAQYVQSLLSQIDEMNRTHSTLQSSYKALCHKTAGLQGQIEVLKEKLEFWSRVEVVLLKTPEDDQAILGSGTTTNSVLTGADYSLYPDLSYHIGS
ncbi:hypothetical protein BJX64DRAFT_282983 [Aspergillus heterothallicus]